MTWALMQAEDVWRAWHSHKGTKKAVWGTGGKHSAEASSPREAGENHQDEAFKLYPG